MLKNRNILIFFIVTFLSISYGTEGKKHHNKKAVIRNEEKINETLPIPMIHKSFPSVDKKEYLASPKYKLGVCMIGKNFSSMIDRIFCFLNNSNKKKFKFGECQRTHRHESLSIMQKTYRAGGVKNMFKNYQMLMIVRNPIDRLISGFMQLCYFRIYLKPNEDYCYGCGRNFNCFVSKLQKELWKVAKNKMIPNQFHDYHFYPQTWQCAYYKFKPYYTYIKYPSSNKSSFYKTIINHLDKAHVPKKHLTFLYDKMYSIKTEHTTNSREATKLYKDSLYNNITLLKKVCAIFYHDFIEFNYDLPSGCYQSPKNNSNNSTTLSNSF
uniref:Sulfotransfer_1 domain-containing protein n=1 Tax=Strongyloides papillosus TaxID=174720 RepID=A0A0N5BJ11_STREA